MSDHRMTPERLAEDASRSSAAKSNFCGRRTRCCEGMRPKLPVGYRRVVAQCMCTVEPYDDEARLAADELSRETGAGVYEGGA